MLSRVLSRSDEFVPSSASFLPGFGSKVDEAVSREPSDSPGSTSGSPRLIAAKYSSGLFFQVKALPTPAAAGLEAVAELWDVPDRQVVIFPFSATSSLAVTDWRLAWPRRFPPTASLIRPKPDRASLIFPATLLKTVFLSASRSLGLSATLVAEPGGNAEYTAEPSSFLLISNSSSAGRDCASHVLVVVWVFGWWSTGLPVPEPLGPLPVCEVDKSVDIEGFDIRKPTLVLARDHIHDNLSPLSANFSHCRLDSFLHTPPLPSSRFSRCGMEPEQSLTIQSPRLFQSMLLLKVGNSALGVFDVEDVLGHRGAVPVKPSSYGRWPQDTVRRLKIVVLCAHFSPPVTNSRLGHIAEESVDVLVVQLLEHVQRDLAQLDELCHRLEEGYSVAGPVLVDDEKVSVLPHIAIGNWNDRESGRKAAQVRNQQFSEIGVLWSGMVLSRRPECFVFWDGDYTDDD
ncbi:hypothetical protein TPAR_05328 [Tolypocladium paradoxum]|uniref:Uncharacterized protein n=1 Tax=Tolypocladium paradoxum TaxID=94208 RepID=A0A2S4KW98_9HYPO|nr:hypothetical protein TPAR_05328 [Tolypocladium paradoxum]